MANFNYKAKDLRGTDYSGEIESSDIRSAALLLRKKGLIVININTKGSSSESFTGRFLNRVGFNELVTTTRQLATMVGAGLVLSDSIDILEEQQTSKTLKRVLGDVSRDIKGGLTLSQALSKHPRVFPSLYINLVKAGESSGKLDVVLNKMADTLEKEREFKARVKGALIYPIVVVTMMSAVAVMMIVFVIPKLTSLYAESSIELPLPTKILITISNLFINLWWLLILIAIGGSIIFRRWIKTPEGAMMYDRVLLRVPIVGKIIINVTLTNFSRTFALLISAGIPLLDAINIVTDVTDNNVFKKALKEAYGGVARGLSFSSLLQSSVFPKIVGQMVRVGEETGKVDEIFFRLSDYFESEADHMVKNLTVAIEPIVLVVLGLGVAFLVISIILPIYKLTTSF